jgi:hypothetical protein
VRCGWFILLASPKAARSPWVESEVQWWLTHRSIDQMMLVQSAGELHWDPVGNRFDLPRSSAIPPILERAYRHQPRWIDMRWFVEPESLGGTDPRFIERVADLAAPIHGRQRADIVGEDVRQQRRTVRLARGAIATLAILLALSLIATVLAVQQRNAAIQQRDIAVSRQLIRESEDLGEVDPETARPKASPPGASIPPRCAPRDACSGDTARHRRAYGPYRCRLLTGVQPGRQNPATGSDDNSLWMWDVASRRQVGPPLTGHTDAVSAVAFSPDGKTLASSIGTARCGCGMRRAAVRSPHRSPVTPVPPPR